MTRDDMAGQSADLPRAPERIHGVTFGFYARPGYFDSQPARTEVDRMVELNVGWVCLVPTIMQESPVSTRQFRDFEVTPSDLELAEIIDYIHGKGMKVCLRPMIENWDGNGRNQIWFPPDRDSRIPGLKSDMYERWFRGMRARTRYYARMAQKLGCAMYGLDSEIDRFTTMHGRWREVVEVAREVYTGHVNSCHTHFVNFERELEDPEHWFRTLDSLGTSAYHASADRPNASVEEREAFLEPKRDMYRRIAQLLGKPVMFGELGCTACTGAGMRPSSWAGGDKFDADEQADHLEAMLRVFWDEPWWAGFFWWKWEEQNDRPQFKDDPAGDKGFSVYGKKAAEVMKRWGGKQDQR